MPPVNLLHHQRSQCVWAFYKDEKLACISSFLSRSCCAISFYLAERWACCWSLPQIARPKNNVTLNRVSLAAKMPQQVLILFCSKANWIKSQQCLFFRTQNVRFHSVFWGWIWHCPRSLVCKKGRTVNRKRVEAHLTPCTFTYEGYTIAQDERFFFPFSPSSTDRIIGNWWSHEWPSATSFSF